MAMDFPSNPTDGQIYGSYVYNASKGVWQAKPTSATVAINSPIAPPTGNAGDIWFNTNDGTMYVYYNDGTSGQWVESQAPITANGYYSPNYIINGGMDILQRAQSVNITGSHFAHKTADRWILAVSASGSTNIDNSIIGFPDGGQIIDGLNVPYFMRWNVNTVGTATAYGMINRMEDVRTLAGSTVTLSFYVKGTQTSTLRPVLIQYFGSGGSADVTINPTGTTTTTFNSTWARKTFTFTVPSVLGKTINANSFIQLQLDALSISTGTMDIAGVQLEEGSVATPFRRNANSIQGELAACQRYYVRLSADASNTSATWGMGFQISTTSAVAAVPLPVTMRRVPDIGSDTVVGNLQWSDSVTYDRQLTGLATGQSTTSLQRVIAYWSGSAGTAGYGGSVRSNAIASGFLSFNAEL